MAVDLDDLRRSHDANGAHSHLYEAIVKVAEGSRKAARSTRRSRRRRRGRIPLHERGPVRNRRASQGVTSYGRAKVRRGFYNRSRKLRHGTRKAQRRMSLGWAVARTTNRTVRFAGRSVVGVVTRPLHTLWMIFLMLLLLVLFTPVTIGGVGRGAADLGGMIIPGSCGQPAMQPVDGADAISYQAGRVFHGMDEPWTPTEMVDGIVGAARWVGRQQATFQRGREGKPAPLEPVPGPMVQGRPPGVGGVPVVAAAATPLDAVAQAVVAAGQAGEPAAELVAVTIPESGDAATRQPNLTARNPESSARGAWQLMIGVHKITEAQAFDPMQAAVIAVRLRDESPKGMAGPWAQTYGVGAHEPYMDDARAAVARAQGVGLAASVGAAGAPSATGCQAPPGGIVRQASLDNAGLANGALPVQMLHPLSWAPGHNLRPEAAAALEALNVAYRERFGADLMVTDSYRDLAGQQACSRAKGSLCAVPGTSEHGWGKAMDLGGGVQRFGTVQHEWMRANAPQFGWYLPGWAHPRSEGGTKPEPWHWEYGEPTAQRAG